MLTRQLRELERQADVVTVRKREIKNVSRLPEGTYMHKDSVLDYLHNRICKSTLASFIEDKCDVYITEDGIQFIPTSQIKMYMMAYLFREMECELVTVMVTKK